MTICSWGWHAFSLLPSITTHLSHTPGHSFWKRKVSQQAPAYHTPAWDSRNDAGSETTLSSQVFKYTAEYRYHLAGRKEKKIELIGFMQCETEKLREKNLWGFKSQAAKLVDIPHVLCFVKRILLFCFVLLTDCMSLGNLTKWEPCRSPGHH